MRQAPYPWTSSIPLGVSLEPCAICEQVILHQDEAVIYQTSKDAPMQMAHGLCAQESLTTIVRAYSRRLPS